MAQSGLLPSALRWMRRIALGLLILIVSLTALGTAYEFYARAKAHENYPPPGRMVDIGGRQMHLDCRGEGSPTVVLESGADFFGSLAWASVQDQISRRTRTCSYDRAGIIWSEPKSTPQDANAVAQDLHAVLTEAGLTGPVVLVGHSLGGPYIMSYTRLFPGEVQGLVFIDASHPDLRERLPEKVGKRPIPMAYKILAALAWTGITRLVPDNSAPWVPDRVKAVSRAYFGESAPAVLFEMESIPATLQQSGELRDLQDRPLVVLTAMEPLHADLLASLGLTPGEGEEIQAMLSVLHRDAASWSSRSRQQDVSDSGHYIQFQRPDLVIGAVNEVLDALQVN
jgi:pimeloyl-ACP methyl ester carboxylesterase